MTFRLDWPRLTATALGVLAGLVAAAGTLAVATAGFTLSYDAIRKVGIAAGVRPDWAWLLPVSVDGAMAVATVTAVVMSRMSRNVWYPWLVVIAGAATSIACNAVHALMRDNIQLDNVTAMAVSAIPAVMLVLSVHLLVVLVDAAANAVRARLAPDKVQASNVVAGVLPSWADLTSAVPAPDTAGGVEAATGTDIAAADAPAEAPASEPAVAPASVPVEPAVTRTIPKPAKTAKTPDTQTRVARLRERQPDLTQAQVAKRLEISERTAARYWPFTTPAVKAEPAKTNGHAVPDLIPTGGAQ